MELSWGPRTFSQLILLENQGLPVSSPKETQGQPAYYENFQLSPWCMWRKRMPGVIKTKRAMIQLESKDATEEFIVHLARAVKDA